ncbi:PaaI family thioesterase [Acidovorax delafieldii]|uniref:PaaI family thioesterase n=1 Tax=Acidovorax delafieldii TaxID=47920 RepID=UPI003757F397
MTAPLTPAPCDALSSGARSTIETLQAVVLAMPMARTLGLRFVHAEPGRVEVEIPVSEAFSFRPGQLQATAVFAVADFAAVAAAGSVLPPGWTNATVDTTLKIVAPAEGECLRARGRVVDAGRLLTVCAADVWAVDAAGQERLCATLLATARNIDMGPRGRPRADSAA